MTATRQNARCPDGFLVGSGLCQVCEPRAASRNPNKVTNEVFVVGFVVGGATILRKLDNDQVELRCACQETFVVDRRALAKCRFRKGWMRCGECRRGGVKKQRAVT